MRPSGSADHVLPPHACVPSHSKLEDWNPVLSQIETLGPALTSEDDRVRPQAVMLFAEVRDHTPKAVWQLESSR
jgi:hypothetical protein